MDIYKSFVVNLPKNFIPSRTGRETPGILSGGTDGFMPGKRSFFVRDHDPQRDFSGFTGHTRP